MTAFLAEHNLPFANVDHLGPLFRNFFPGSEIAKAYYCGKSKALCIFNRAIVPKLQETLVNQMEISCFSIATDGSNERRLEKINHVTVRILVINQDKIVTKCKFICVSLKNPLQKPFSGLLMPLMSKYDILRDNCVSLGVDNASVSVGRYNSVIVKARKENSSIILTGCPCHITHNAASKIKCFSIEELLVDIYFHFDFSSKQKNLFAKF